MESTVEGEFTGGELSGEQQNGGGLLLGVNEEEQREKWDEVCVREAARKCSM